MYYILIGISRRMYTDEQLKKWEKDNHKGFSIGGRKYTNYEATQLMRRLELEIRREKDTAILAQASGDSVLRRECQAKITDLTKEYKAVAEAASCGHALIKHGWKDSSLWKWRNNNGTCKI